MYSIFIAIFRCLEWATVLADPLKTKPTSLTSFVRAWRTALRLARHQSRLQTLKVLPKVGSYACTHRLVSSIRIVVLYLKLSAGSVVASLEYHLLSLLT